MMELLTEQLDEREQAELLRCEEAISQGVRTFIEVGNALLLIRNLRLYRAEFGTFESYLEHRWPDLSRGRAYQLMKAFKTTEFVNTCIQTPITNEAQARPLASLPSEVQPRVWQEAVDTAGGGKVTGRHVRETVERLRPIIEQCGAERVEAAQASEQPELILVAERPKPRQAAFITLDEWALLDESERALMLGEFPASDRQFNRQDNKSIEWAQWSWNPVTGCRHDCPYCYARDIAVRFYPQAFEPSILPERFRAPWNTRVPAQAEQDVAFRNVFTCSMADLFGRWVPCEWIEVVLRIVRDNPQWNFLFLTKFPKRYCEFDFPKNAWLGTSVDCQARVKNAEDAFAKISGGTKWLSVEPLLQPLKFTRLKLFDWVVVGGASASTQTPEWVPPIDWVSDLHQQARAAGCHIYYKDNCGMSEALRIREFPWSEPAKRELPEAFRYLAGLK